MIYDGEMPLVKTGAGPKKTGPQVFPEFQHGAGLGKIP